jgi:ABC-type sugar transport system substrate-binding protein
VFGSDDECALGALAAIRAAGTTGTVVVGFGAGPEARAAITAGAELVADAAPDGGAIGRRVIAAVALALTHAPVPPGTLVPVRLIDRDSLAKQ